MSNLIIELLLRLLKPAAAAALGIVLFAIAVGVGQEPSWTLGLLCFLSGAALILLVQESPL